MGIGLIIVTARDRADALIRELAAPGSLGARVVGELVPGHAPEVDTSEELADGIDRQRQPSSWAC
jgi:uncharacterized protein YbjT (DUF2867 family)